ncbi:hypothetical protein EV182_001976 [Spiromyces aspiralis]|uniref:Uncharacterized protein n=1 Tax=Spiromyces aspiralis TaxID=68401 RepID=A0ACC1HUQ5_9FUNG|nr:hypothetical protein EV182_001976 [Spiromyces aspiralis]
MGVLFDQSCIGEINFEAYDKLNYMKGEARVLGTLLYYASTPIKTVGVAIPESMDCEAEMECRRGYFVLIIKDNGLRAVLASAGLWEKCVAFKRALGPKIRKLADSLSSGQQANSGGKGSKVKTSEPHDPALERGVEAMLRPVVQQLRQALEASPSSRGSSPWFPIRNEYSIGRAKKVHDESKQVDMALTREGMRANDWYNVLTAFEIKRVDGGPTEYAAQYMLYATEMWAR